MYSHRVLITLFSLIFGINGAPTTCNLEDETCVTKAFTSVFTKVVNGVPEYGIESSEIIKKDLIVAVLPKLNYTLKNNEFTGFTGCKVVSAKFMDGSSKLEFSLNCPYFSLKAQYEVHGKILLLNVEGQGDCEVRSENYDVTFDIDVEKMEKDGKTYINLKDFITVFNVHGGVVYDFKNLFNGNEELSKAVHDAVNSNWKTISKEVNGPGTRAFFEIFVQKLKKYFENVPIDAIFAV